jgi:hypothetical protein
MNKIIQFPRQRPGKKWSPAEILAIKEPLDTREITRQERSRIATTNKIASEACRRDRKRAKRKKAITDILDSGQQWTVSVLMRLVGERTGQSVSRTTVTALLKELEGEGRCSNTNQFWWKTTNDK